MPILLLVWHFLLPSLIFLKISAMLVFDFYASLAFSFRSMDSTFAPLLRFSDEHEAITWDNDIFPKLISILHFINFWLS